MIEIKLSRVPVPKTNRYVRKRNGAVFIPPRVKNWEVRALWEIRNQWNGEPIDRKISVDITLILPNHRKRDIDNMLKSLWDLLEKAGVLKNDNLIYEVRTVKKVERGKEGVLIRITDFHE
jgi:crossover junction endodeoxyribonuclease RusA